MLRIGMFLADRYEILEKIGSGGMADVYKAKCHKLNRLVAIKVLKEEFCKDKTFVTKFRVEAQSAAGLSHGNIVGIYDVGEEADVYFIVMELVEGITLKDYIGRKHKLGIKESIGIAIQVAQGLEVAHAQHIVHRDIKPQNIIISREGKIKVTDFGIARAITDETTNMYGAAGSVHYISPEQARGGYCDERSDIYSLGITLYEMVTGRVPFDGDTTVAVAIAHINDAMIPPSHYEPSVPIAVEQIIFKCTQKKAERRYLSCSELIADLRQAIVAPDTNFVTMNGADVNLGASTVIMSEQEVNEIRGQREHEMIENLPSPQLKVTPLVSGSNTAKASAQGAAPQNKVTAPPKRTRQEIEYEDDDYEDDDYDDEYEEEEEERGSAFDKIILVVGIAFGVILIALLIYIVGTVTGMFGGSTPDKSSAPVVESSTDETLTVIETSEGQTIDMTVYTKMPDLFGLTFKEAEELMDEAELKLDVRTKFSEEYDKNLVCGQQANPDAYIKRGTTVRIYLSRGSDKFTIDDKYIGMSKIDFEQEINPYDLSTTFEGEYSDEAKINTIIRLEPSSGILTSGDKLKVIYSMGPERVPIPDLRSLTKESATNLLKSSKLNIGTVTEEFSDLDVGMVCGQYPAAGEKVKQGSTVNIVISKGRNQAAVPSVVGKDEATATSELKNAGFNVSTTTQSSDTVAKGYVISQSVPGGTNKDYGTTINIVISEGSADIYLPDNIESMTPAQARDEIIKLGLNAVEIEEYNATVPTGGLVRIYSSDGPPYKKGDTVTIVISKGPEPTEPTTEPPTESTSPLEPAPPETSSDAVVTP